MATAILVDQLVGNLVHSMHEAHITEQHDKMARLHSKMHVHANCLDNAMYFVGAHHHRRGTGIWGFAEKAVRLGRPWTAAPEPEPTAARPATPPGVIHHQLSWLNKFTADVRPRPRTVLRDYSSNGVRSPSGASALEPARPHV
jgi:hypothetical protein